MSCFLGIEQSCDECRMCQDKKEEQERIETVKERKDDLISRSAVMELIESKFVDGCLEQGDKTLIDGYGLLDEVFELPIAYDAEKVVEQLNQQAEQYRARANEFVLKGMIRQCEYMKGKLYSYEHAIEIAKKGGANE